MAALREFDKLEEAEEIRELLRQVVASPGRPVVSPRAGGRPGQLRAASTALMSSGSMRVV